LIVFLHNPHPRPRFDVSPLPWVHSNSQSIFIF
jgi:hypothetical protein